MGQDHSAVVMSATVGTNSQPQQRYEMRSMDKAPTKIVITKPPVAESKAVLQVPHTNVKILHVDPNSRAGIVPSHGYIALQVVPLEQQSVRESSDGAGGPTTPQHLELDSNTKKRARDMKDSQRTPKKGDLSVSPQGNSLKSPGSKLGAHLDITSDPGSQRSGPINGDEMLERAIAEYNEEEHGKVAREVKKWKLQFRAENNRPPTKKDIANNPYIFESYYREKELDAMLKLIEENARLEEEAAVEAAVPEKELVRELSAVEVARSEFNAMELFDLQREVKKWKSAFKQANNRPPTKKDIAEDETMYQKYYRVKELETMQKLIEEADAADAAALREVVKEADDGDDGAGRKASEADAIENARAQFDGEEYAALAKEVKAWKLQFKELKGRPPTKRDISEDPEMYAKYYREKELESMKKLIEEADTQAHDALQEAFLKGDDEALVTARAAFNAEEHATLALEVKAWKLQFKELNGRPPTKRDISEDPEMYAKYYREKELESMKKLIEEAEAILAVEAENPAASRRLSDSRKHVGFRSAAFGVQAAKRLSGSRRDSSQNPSDRKKLRPEAIHVTASVAPPEAVSTSPGNPFGGDGRDEVLQSFAPLGDANDDVLQSFAPLSDGKDEEAAAALLPHRPPVTKHPQFVDSDEHSVDVTTSLVNPTSMSFTVTPHGPSNNAEEEAPSSDRLAPLMPLGKGAEDFRNKAPAPLMTLAAKYDANGATIRDDDENEEGRLDDYEAFDIASPDAVETQFVCPKGHQAQERVFFFDKALQLDEAAERKLNVGSVADGDAIDPISKRSKYELEEDEIYELAGVNRPQVTQHEEDEDPLATYETESNVLNALRLAIDAPMEEFRVEGGEELDDYVDSFMKEAMKESHALFELQRVKDEQFQKTYSVAQMQNSRSAKRMGTMGRKLMSKVKSGKSGMQITAFGLDTSEEASPQGNRAGSEPTAAGAEDDDEFAGMSHDDLVRERKRLHKLLNNYKNSFTETHGRAPEPFEMAQDPDIRDVFAQYHKLKKKTKFEAIVDAAVAQAGLHEPHSVDANKPPTPPPPPVPAEEEERKVFNPFQKILEEKVLRKRGVLAPMAEPEEAPKQPDADPAQEKSAEEIELEVLTKEVKIWKKIFKEREGRNPTRRDIKTDETIAEKYFRQKELEALLGKGSAVRDEEEAAAPPPQRDTEGTQPYEGFDVGGATADEGNPFAPTDAETYNPNWAEDEGVTSSLQPLSEAELVRCIQTIIEEEEIERRDAEADESIAFRFINTQAVADGVIVPEEEKARRAAELRRVQSMKHEKDERPGVTSTTPMMMLDEGSSNRRKSVSNLAPAVAGEVEEIEAVEEAPQKDLTGWTFPADEERHGGTGDGEGAAEGDDTQQQHPLASALQEATARKKKLGKDLNQWKAQFKQANNRQPTTKDIRQNPLVQKLYDEYQDTVKLVEDLQSEMKAEEKAARKQLVQSPVDEEDDDPLTILKKQRRKLANEIADWKAEFRALEGRAPTLKDISSNAMISTVYQEYMRVQDKLGEGGAQAAEGGSEANGVVAMALRRKQLGRQLNEWKAKFFDTNGRNPNVRDIKTNKEAALMYEEYNLIPKNVEDDAAQQLETTENAVQDDAAQLKEAKLRKKELNKVLNDWKANFTDTMGRKPKVSDILSDPLVAAVYNEFQELQTALAQYKIIQEQGGAVGGGGGAPQHHTAFGEMVEEEGASPTTATAGDKGFHSNNPSPPPRAPHADGEQEPEEPPQRAGTPIAKKKKRVTKKLNQWKADFKEREGRNPTKADIKKDAEAKALFDEYQMLKQQLGGGDDGDQQDEQGQGAEHAEKPPADGPPPPQNGNDGDELPPDEVPWGMVRRSPKPAFLTIEETSAAPQADGGDVTPTGSLTPGGRKNNRHSTSGGRKEGADVTQSTVDRIPTVDEVSGPVQLTAEVNIAVNDQLVDGTEGGSLTPSAAKKKKKRKSRSDAAEAVGLDSSTPHSEVPSPSSQLDPGSTTPRSAASPSSQGTVTTTPQPRAEEQLEGSTGGAYATLKADKKALTKRLNQWKASFTESNGRPPKQSDIAQDKEMLQLYEELKSIKAQLKASGGGDADE